MRCKVFVIKTKDRIHIFGDKTKEAIKYNNFRLCQFGMWIVSEMKYVEKSLRTKNKTDAVELTEELYIKLCNEFANGKI